ncbi:glycosyltransferase [Reichenbachiella carrageenanivorans]|uniref:Glycosyltransferase n=1 Tax=Reichenbachiella carrageenanivorans TaxID=2979869 RepID=A0ABY6D091_9BACT|nr:glycosyltransferase [Reichenbachiella carrageenanivorans]UXX79557.1 glycosyltransferase [Reichenbachiella carrageenanivorans]
MFCLVDCNNFWSPSGGGVRRYHLEKLKYYKQRPEIRYVFVMHDERTYTEQVGENTFVEHLKVPKVMGNWEYRYLIRASVLAPLLVKLDPDVIEVGSPYFMPKVVNAIVKKYTLKAKVFGFWHADFPVTYVRRFLGGWPFGLASKGESIAWRHARNHYNTMSGVLASSQLIIRRMQRHGMQRVHFVPLGVDQINFHPERRDPQLVSDLKAGESERLVLFFPHRFCHEKGLSLLLAAYPMICQQLAHAPALVLAGMGPDLMRVKQATQDYTHVHYLGFVDGVEQMATYYASADLGFALSAWETFGLSLVEALSAGLPLIAANDGAAKEHIEKSGAGYILENLTPEGLCDKIVTFAKDLNKDIMKLKARQYAAQLSWDNCFDTQLRLYQS